jgi:capsular polysaccharide biosynthesis protein
MRPPPAVPTIGRYLLLLSRSWWVIVLATVLSAGSGWLVWHNDPTWVAATRVLVVTPGGAQPPDAYYGNLSARTRTLTLEQLAQSAQVTGRAIDQFELQETSETLAEKIVAVPTESSFIELRVQGDSPKAAQDAANSITGNLIAVVNEIETLDKGSTELLWVDQATYASDGRPSKWRSMLMGAGVGLAWSVVGILAYWLLIGTLFDRNQVTRVVQAGRAERNL